MLHMSYDDSRVRNANADLAQPKLMCVFEHTRHEHIM